MNWARRSILIAALTVLPILAMAGPNIIRPINGTAIIHDGDTLSIGKQRIRLQGVSAPEFSDPRGPRSRAALEDIVNGRDLACWPDGTKSFKRIVARCFIGEIDIGRALIVQGWAFADRRFAQDYDGAELAARRSGLGLWGRPDNKILSSGFLTLLAALLGGVLAIVGGWLQQHVAHKREVEAKRRAIINGIGSEIAGLSIYLGEAANTTDQIRTRAFADLKNQMPRYNQAAADLGWLDSDTLAKIDGCYKMLLILASTAQELRDLGDNGFISKDRTNEVKSKVDELSNVLVALHFGKS
jgi:endonuclease YncB( thermonuclease family)